jgi:amidase
MDEFRLDAVVMPTNGPPFGIDLVNGDGQVMGSSAPAATAGYPAITVPVGYSFGLPMGLSFVGRACSEPTLLRLAYAYEQQPCTAYPRNSCPPPPRAQPRPPPWHPPRSPIRAAWR